jgi:hypothetical protein
VTTTNISCPGLEELRDQLERTNETIARHLETCRRCRALLRLLAEEAAPLPSSATARAAPEPIGEPSAAARQRPAEVADGSVVVASSPEAPGELLLAVVLDTESEAAGSDGLVVAPLSTETELATDADVVLDRGQTPLGYQVMAEIWNHGTLLRAQLEEQRGLVDSDAWEKLAGLYAAAIGELEDKGVGGQTSAAPVGDGPPIIADEDPRLLFQDEEVERAQRFYLPAARLLVTDIVQTDAETGERDEGALTAGSLLSAWLEEQGYEANEYARASGFERGHVELVRANRIDPVLLNHDLVAAILARPYRDAGLDRDDLDAALSRSFDDDANWALVGASGRGRVFARTSGRRGIARAAAMRGHFEGKAAPLAPDEVERRKRAYINDVLVALEEKADR